MRKAWTGAKARSTAGRYLLATAAALGFSLAQAQSLQEIEWLTEEYAPYNYTDNGTVTGIAVDTLVEMWRKLGIDRSVSDIRVLPWARGYRMAQDQPGTCLFSTTVTEPRKALFSFVEPVIDTRVAILAPKARKLRIDAPADLERYSVGVVREDIGEHLLQEAGMNDNLQRTDSARSLVRMLDGGRFDAISYSLDTALWNMHVEGIDTEKYENALTVREGVLGYACHKATDPAVIGQMQEALDALRADGTLERIRQKYIR